MDAGHCTGCPGSLYGEIFATVDDMLPSHGLRGASVYKMASITQCLPELMQCWVATIRSTFAKLAA